MPITSSSGQVYPVIHGYEITRPIGGGGFSRVFKAINPKAKQHQVAAIKVVHYALPLANSTRQQHPPDRKALQKEVQLHAVLKHPAVLEFIAVEEVGVGKTGELAASKANHVTGLYMVLELAVGGDLFDKIPPDVGLEEELAHFYFHQLIAALEYIHGQGITHRDVKPENLLLDAEGNLKLADFGLCGVYKYKGKERELNGACGSLPYIAPEMNGNPYRGEPVDVWSSGAVLFAMLVGNTPWDEPTAHSAEYIAYLTGELFGYDPWPRISGDALSLLRKMLCPDAAKRITLAQIKQHRWYKRPNELLQSGLCRDPVSLAERLLHGLIVSGDLAFDLHTDGERAKVPETVSLTQPEWNGQSGKALEGDWGDWRKALPPSSAVPALGTEASKQRRKRQEAFSQQIELRRAALPAATVEAQMAGAPASQFTQALNHYTQWSTLAIGRSKFSPHLTRFFCTAEPAEITKVLVKQLSALRVQNDVQGLGEQADVIKDDDGDIAMAMDDETNGSAKSDAASDAAKVPRSGSGLQVAMGSRGARIRLSTTDQRKCLLKGDIRVESLAHKQASTELPEGAVVPRTMVFMGRSRGSPMEWRRLFRALTREPAIRATMLDY